MNPQTPEEKEMTARCQYWQGVLKLSDWEFLVYFVTQKDFESNCIDGTIELHSQNHRGIIRILDPAITELENNSETCIKPWVDSVDFVLVHELLHAKLYFEQFEGAEQILLEQCLNDLSRTIVAAYKLTNNDCTLICTLQDKVDSLEQAALLKKQVAGTLPALLRGERLDKPTINSVKDPASGFMPSPSESPRDLKVDIRTEVVEDLGKDSNNVDETEETDSA